jgi:2-oxoglutarate dehydrogenase E1 component
MKDFSYITNSSPSFIESLYQDYSKDPDSIDPELRKFFEGFDFAMANGKASANGGSNGQPAAKTAETTAMTTDGVDWIPE